MAPRPEPKPRILLMGVGSVGGVLAAGLLSHGHDVTLVTHNRSITDALIHHGLSLTTPRARRATAASLRATLHTGIHAVEGPFDIVLLAMKATDVEGAARDVLPLLAPYGYLVTLQNGIVEDQLLRIFDRARPLGPEPVIPAVIGWSATMHEPGVYEMTSEGQITVGELNGELTERVHRLRGLLDTVSPTSISTNIRGVLWSKLAINCATAPLGAIGAQPLGALLQRGYVRCLALAAISEALDVAEAGGIRLEPVGGTLDLRHLYLSPGRREGIYCLGALVRHAKLRAVGLKFRRLKSSMLHSLQRGRQPEIDFLNGYIVARGKELGIATPVNAALTEIVREIAAGAREITPQNLTALTRS